jgi:c-di-GMP-binding flagellar brake protein YcgR
MEEAYVKHDMFEIIAIMREAVKKRSRIDIQVKNSVLASRIQKIDSNGFFIPWNEELTKKHNSLSFIIHDDNGKYDFQTTKALAVTVNSTNFLYVRFPEKINVTQRRMHLRLYLAKKHNFQCYGKFNDGRKYHYKIKDISHGGCALIVENDEHVNSLRGTTLRNVEFDFNHIGTLVSNLHVINVEPIKEIMDNDESYRDCLHLSCQFKRMSESTQRKLDNIIVKLLLEEKRLHRL